MPAHVDELAGCRVGGRVDRLSYGLVAAADRGQGQHRQQRVHQPPPAFGCAAAGEPERIIQITSPSSSGGHTQPNTFCTTEPVGRSEIRPARARNTAGAAAQRCGWSLNRTDSTASKAQPKAKPSSTTPVRTFILRRDERGGDERHGRKQSNGQRRSDDQADASP